MELVDLTKLDPKGIAKGLRSFYQAAYSTPSFSYSEEDMDEFEGRFSHHSEFDGFRILGAYIDSTVVGFTYGFTFPDGRWWRGSIDDEPAELSGKSLFGLIELAVSEPHRGQGYARILHDALLSSRSEAYATLLARPDSAAYRIYPKWGWTVAGKVQSYPGWPTDHVLIHSLPLDATGKTYEIRELTEPPAYAER